MLHDAGVDPKYINERDDTSLIELLLEYALDQSIDLAIIQSAHVQGMIDMFGGFYVVHKFWPQSRWTMSTESSSV